MVGQPLPERAQRADVGADLLDELEEAVDRTLLVLLQVVALLRLLLPLLAGLLVGGDGGGGCSSPARRALPAAVAALLLAATAAAAAVAIARTLLAAVGRSKRIREIGRLSATTSFHVVEKRRLTAPVEHLRQSDPTRITNALYNLTLRRRRSPTNSRSYRQFIESVLNPYLRYLLYDNDYVNRKERTVSQFANMRGQS